jgi:hypothetical protein
VLLAIEVLLAFVSNALVQGWTVRPGDARLGVLRAAARDHPVTALIGGLGAAVLGGVLFLLAVALTFAGVSCAYVPPSG